jgi:hypothetical protein
MSRQPVSDEMVECDIREVLSWWPRPSLLADLATRRIGFGHEGYGLSYPEGIDDHDREAPGIHVPAGHVDIYGFYGNPDGGFEHIVPETVYLGVLAQVLREQELTSEAEAVERLIPERRL